MSDFYCRNCAAKRGWPNIPDHFNITGTRPQKDKFGKHTQQSSGNYPVVSRYNDPSPANYSGLMGSALASGYFEVDDLGRTALVWRAGKVVGHTFSADALPRPDDAVKVVNYQFPDAIHHYSTAFPTAQNRCCADCGQPLP